MTPAEYAALAAHFEAACDLDAPARRRYLAEIPAGPQRRALAEMLAADDDEADPLAQADLEGAARAVFQTDEVDQAPPFPRIDDRYTVDTFLGSGGAGRVFRGLDLQTGQPVAVKLLDRAVGADERAVLRFRREYQAAARLDHPGVVKALTAGVHDGWPYLVTEFVPGGDLSRLIGAPAPQVIGVLAELAQILDHVHSRRVVHRDLKPANVLLTRDDPPRPKLADFGIARHADGSARITQTELVVGTPDFLAPEQLANGVVDPRADLYALGTLIHLLFAGRLPFEQGGMVQRLAARQTQAAPDLAERAEVPPGLARLAAELLAIAPEDRPQSALEVAFRLDGLRAELLGQPARAAQPRLGGYIYPTPFVGRASAVAELTRAHARAHQGHAGRPAVQVLGPAGQGKARLVQAWADARGLRLTWCRVPQETTALAPLRALAAALPGTVPTPAWAAPAPQLGQALAQAARASSGRGPVLVVDGAHRATRRVREALAHFVRALSRHARPPFLVLTAEAALTWPGLATVELGPLPLDAVQDLAAGMLGVGRSNLPPGLLTHLDQTAGGSPAFVRLLVEEAVDGGTLRRVPGGWRFIGRPGEAPPSVLALATARLARLPPDARATLAEVALLGDLVLLADAVHCTERSTPTVLEAVNHAVDARVARIPAGPTPAVQFTHGAAAHALKAQLAPERAAVLHGRFAALLEARGAPLEATAWHHGRGPDPSTACAWLVRAADAAEQGADHAAAREALTQAWARAPHRADLGERLLDALLALGDGSGAVMHAAALLAQTPSPVARARLLRKQARARVFLDDVLGGVQDLERALVALGRAPPAARIQQGLRGAADLVAAVIRRWLGPGREPARDAERMAAHRELALVSRWVDLERTGAQVTAQLRAAERLGAPAGRADAYAALASGLSMSGLPRAARRYQQRALALTVAAPEVLPWLHFLWAGAQVFTRADWAPALARFDEAILGAQARGDRLLAVLANGARGWTHMLLGAWPAARADLDEAARQADALGWGWLRTDAALAHAVLALAQGDLGDARATADGVLAGEALPAHRALATELRAGVAFVHGRWATAHGDFEAAAQLYRAHRLERGWGFLIDVEVAESAVWAADAGAPVDLVAVLRRCVARSRRRMEGMPYLRGYHAALRGVLAARLGKARKAERLFEAAMAARPAAQTYVDHWLAVRMAVERRRLGLGDTVQATVAEVDAAFQAAELHGMRRWLRAADAVLQGLQP